MVSRSAERREGGLLPGQLCGSRRVTSHCPTYYVLNLFVSRNPPENTNCCDVTSQMLSQRNMN